MACIRGSRIYDSLDTKIIVQKWIRFYKVRTIPYSIFWGLDFTVNIRSFTGILNLVLLFSEIPWYSTGQYHSCQKSRYAINRCFSSRSRHFVLQWWYQRIGHVFQSNLATPEHIHKFAVVLYRVGRKCNDNFWRTLNLFIHVPIESRLFDWHTDRYVMLIVENWMIIGCRILWVFFYIPVIYIL